MTNTIKIEYKNTALYDPDATHQEILDAHVEQIEESEDEQTRACVNLLADILNGEAKQEIINRFYSDAIYNEAKKRVKREYNHKR